MLRVWLVTSWNEACGIAEHSRMLKEHVERADSRIEITPGASWLDPRELFAALGWSTEKPDIVHLNHHDALHARWDLAAVATLEAQGIPVVVTYHDTHRGTETEPNSDKARWLCGKADAFIVHEPVADLPGAIYMRQGVLPEQNPLLWYRRTNAPIVGTCGFDFPWKNFTLLAQASKDAGWGVAFVGGNLQNDRIEELRAINPNLQVVTGFPPADVVVAHLSACDATAFLYLCGNTGTSGAIRLGLAARQPLIATHPRHCRQFRDLDWEISGITWLDDLSVEGVAKSLATLKLGRPTEMYYRAEQDSWARVGEHYADLYRKLVPA